MDNKKRNNKEILQYAGLATQWLVMLSLSLWLGIQLDAKMGPKSRLFTIALPLIALTFSLIRLVQKFNKPKK